MLYVLFKVETVLRSVGSRRSLYFVFCRNYGFNHVSSSIVVKKSCEDALQYVISLLKQVAIGSLF